MDLGMESLSNEILTCISELLDISHPPSLVAFAQTSKRHYAISSRWLFRTVLIAGESSELPRRAQKWESMLLRNGAFTYVRRLVIYSCGVKRELPDNPYLALEPCERDDDATRLQSCWDLYRDLCVRHPISWEVRNEDCRDLARLLRQLRGLTDTFYVCNGQFPPCLLETLHVELPQCRLHNYTFNLTDPNGAYERSLATSPCLYGIGDLGRLDNGTGLSLAVRHAPRLKNFFLWLWDPIDFVIVVDVSGVSPLEHFQLDARPTSEMELPSVVVHRIAFGDLSALRVLKLNIEIDHRTLPAPDDFPSLVTLTLTCPTSSIPDQYWDNLLAFLRDLPSLTTLQLKRWKRSVPVVSGLSPNLRTLNISTHVTRDTDHLRIDHIQRLAELCPHLEDLTIEIPRSRGDASEVALYRALGLLPRLQRVALSLDVSQPPPVRITARDGTVTSDTVVEPWFDVWDTEYIREGGHTYRNGHVRDILVNHAVDDLLVRSIFEVMDSTKKDICGKDVLTLELLEVSVEQANLYVQDSLPGASEWLLRMYTDALHRKWSVKRDVRDDARHIFHVCRTDRGGMLRLTDIGKTRLVGLNGEEHFAGVWKRLWPDRGDGRDWWDAWQSWPLDLESEG
jgi:hypothetical protein